MGSASHNQQPGFAGSPEEDPLEDPFVDHPELAELDRLYQQALSAMENVEEGVVVASESTALASDALHQENDPLATVPTMSSLAATHSPGEAFSHPLPASRGRVEPPTNVDERPLEPRRILEAALFVGGEPLTTRKLCGLFQGEFEPSDIESLLDDLNGIYLAEERPYEIRLAEGGYRLALREEYEPVRHRVFGLGPREVRLSQEALEILSLVAYRQPLTRDEIEQIAPRANVGPVLNQLLRRQLVQLERHGNDAKEIRYLTTPRFLEVFGLANLDDLPRAEDLNFK